MAIFRRALHPILSANRDSLAISMPRDFPSHFHDLPYRRKILFAGLGNLLGKIPKVANFLSARVKKLKKFDLPSGTALAQF